MKTLKMRTKPSHKLEPQGVIRPTLNSWEHSLLILNVSMRHLKVKTLYSSIIHPFGYLKWHGFHGNPLCDFNDWECSFKNIHISAASHPGTLNLLSGYFADKARLQDCKICKLTHLNIHEC